MTSKVSNFNKQKLSHMSVTIIIKIEHKINTVYAHFID